MLDVVPLRYGTAFKKAFSDPLAFHALVRAAVGIDFMPDRVEQEYSYREPVARINVAYDLFAEDKARRTIVELLHVCDKSSYDRFLHYHAVGMIEQITSSDRYVFDRDVYTLVVFTRWPDEPALRFGRAICNFDPVTDEGAALGVYRHRLVFINARAPLERLPEALRPLVGLIEDTLDGQVDEARYGDEVSQHILARIRRERMTATENARLKDEATWEAAKREERQEGRAEGHAEGRAEGLTEGRAAELRTGVADLCEAYGLTLTPAQQAHLASLDLGGLEALRSHIKRERRWPG
ncbi:MAG: hypothetical protein U0359_20500 [Byssovorax sp.]